MQEKDYIKVQNLHENVSTETQIQKQPEHLYVIFPFQTNIARLPVIQLIPAGVYLFHNVDSFDVF